MVSADDGAFDVAVAVAVRVGRPTWRKVALAAIVVLACSDNPLAPVVAPVTSGAPSLAKVSGDGQGAQVAASLPESLKVRLVDGSGKPVSGRNITWTVGSESGSLAGASSPTNADGRAAVLWTLGTKAGSQTATAAIDGSPPIAFAATAAAAGAAMVRLSPDTSVLELGATVRLSPTAADKYGNAVGEVLGYLAGDGSEAELFQDFPQLTHEDVLACFEFAAERERRTVVATVAAPA